MLANVDLTKKLDRAEYKERLLDCQLRLRKLAFELKKKKASVQISAEGATAGRRNAEWDPRVRAAEARVREAGELGDEDQALLAELDAGRDSAVTVCAAEDFGYLEDAVCRACGGYAECAARRIRLAAGDDGGGE